MYNDNYLGLVEVGTPYLHTPPVAGLYQSWQAACMQLNWREVVWMV